MIAQAMTDVQKLPNFRSKKTKAIFISKKFLTADH